MNSGQNKSGDFVNNQSGFSFIILSSSFQGDKGRIEERSR